jgi:hypothetical protein
MFNADMFPFNTIPRHHGGLSTGEGIIDNNIPVD